MTQDGMGKKLAWFVALVVLAGLAGVLFIRHRERGKEPDFSTALDSAWTRFRRGDFSLAIDEFDRLAQRPQLTNQQQLQAWYGLACAWGLRQPDPELERAAQLFKAVIERDPKSDLAAWSRLALVRQQHLVKDITEADYERVAQAYREIYQLFPDHLAGQEAFLHLMAVNLRSRSREAATSVKAEIQKFIDNHPDSPFQSSAWSLVSTCEGILEDARERLAADIKALETLELDPSNPRVDKSGRYWSIAATAEFAVGDFAVARTFYQRLIEEYPQDGRIFGAKNALERMDKVERGLASGRPRSEWGLPVPY